MRTHTGTGSPIGNSGYDTEARPDGPGAELVEQLEAYTCTVLEQFTYPLDDREAETG